MPCPLWVSLLWLFFSCVPAANQWNVQCISPQLIIIRIADGTAWKQYEVPKGSAIGLREATLGMSLRFSAKAKTDSQYSTTDADLGLYNWCLSLSWYHFPVVVDKTVSVDVAIIWAPNRFSDLIILWYGWVPWFNVDQIPSWLVEESEC